MAGIYKLVPKMFIGVHKQTYKPILNKKGYYYFMEKLQGMGGMGGMGGFDKEKRDGMMGTSSSISSEVHISIPISSESSSSRGMGGFDKEKRDGMMGTSSSISSE